MRNAHKISGRSKVLWGGGGGGDREFRKNAKGREVNADFLIEMAIDVVFRLG